MAWLFACFGYSKKRKRLKSSHRIHSQDKGIGSYQPLESPSSCLPEDSEEGNPKPIRSNLKRRKQDKTRNRKKVRFDLNVIVYEPIQAYGDDYDNDEDDDLRSILAAAMWGEQEVEDEEENTDLLLSKGNSTGVKREQSCTFTYRYNNCDDDDDDDDEELGSDIEDYLYEDEEEEEDNEDEEVTRQTDEKRVREKLEKSLESLETDVNPVLIPIENLNQWRAIKMKKWEIVA